MLIVLNFAVDKGFQVVVIGQRALVWNRAAGIDRAAGIAVRYTISSALLHLTFSLFRMSETSHKVSNVLGCIA
jgi:hypothetical protein